MISLAETGRVSTIGTIYPFGPPTPGAIPRAQSYVEALGDYSAAAAEGAASLPHGGDLQGLEATLDRAQYRFMRALVGAQPLPSPEDATRAQRFSERPFWTPTPAKRGAFALLEEAPVVRGDTWDSGGHEALVVEAHMDYFAACEYYSEALPFEAWHDPYIQRALTHRMLHAACAWQINEALDLAARRGYKMAEDTSLRHRARLALAGRRAAALAAQARLNVLL